MTKGIRKHNDHSFIEYLINVMRRAGDWWQASEQELLKIVNIKSFKGPRGCSLKKILVHLQKNPKNSKDPRIFLRI